jgi:uncharacterized membrane protein
MMAVRTPPVLQFIPIALAVYSYFVVRTNLPTLPQRIPMHFNAAGFADGWGSPDSLWILFGAQALCCAIFLLIPYLGQIIPGAIHFGSKRLSDYPEEQRPQMLAMLNDMAACMNIVMNLFFVILLRQVIHAATQAYPQIHPVLPLIFMGVGMVSVLVYFGFRFYSAGKEANPPRTTP